MQLLAKFYNVVRWVLQDFIQCLYPHKSQNTCSQIATSWRLYMISAIHLSFFPGIPYRSSFGCMNDSQLPLRLVHANAIAVAFAL